MQSVGKATSQCAGTGGLVGTPAQTSFGFSGALHSVPAHDEAPIAGRAKVVLPRLMRKPVRYFQRLLTGGIRFSKRALAASLATALVLAGGIIAHRSGHFENLYIATTAHAGLRVASFEITGNREVPDTQVIAALADQANSTIFGFDVGEAREALMGVSWIDDARVSRIYPDTIRIELTEHLPLAIWQSRDGMAIVGQDGRILQDYDGNPRGLPLVVGDGAHVTATEILTSLQEYPEVASQVRALVRVGERRWDLELTNRVTVMLPEGRETDAVGRLAVLATQKDLLDRDIVSIDMRLSDRMVVRLAETAHEAIKAAREETIKRLIAAKKERQI